MVETGLFGWDDVARVMSTTPAAIGRLAGYAAPFRIGAPAHLSLVDPKARGAFDASRLASRSRNSPYLGREVPGRVVHVFHSGDQTVIEGEVR